MANISVAELLLDLDFVDPVEVVRSVEVVGDDGIVVYETQRYQILASIQSASGDELLMTPDLARTGGTYEIITTFPLVTATDAHKSDTVIWRGVEFVLLSVGMFNNFGGQYEGVMTIKTISPSATSRS